MDTLSCPQCQSTDTRFSQPKNQQFCRDCGYHWSPVPAASAPVSLSEADTADAK
jgi:hypothetical protein